MKKYLMLIMLTIVPVAQAYDRRPPGHTQANKKCCCHTQNICCRITQNICSNFFYAKESFCRALMSDSSSFSKLKKQFENEYASVDLAIALVLFEKHWGCPFDRFMLADFAEENTFELNGADLAQMEKALISINDSVYIESIYQRLWYLSVYEKKALLTALRFRRPMLHATYRHRHLNEEKLRALEPCLLKILEKIAEDD